ncbi:hypothetical protein [Candidatus Laterigemmans baculatus]|uniref:hypothetical protein n=1 Tax=Candidatus Laterigemmans baculatus TaxID=2770505 RepID=UPI0013D8ED12|nr:hypothetical protein [Candidatus Laterigemmans baculatus]
MSETPQPPSSPRSSSPRSSSPRSSGSAAEGAVDVVLWSGEHAAGPVRLPRTGGERFVEEFNRIYAPLGWKMEEAG